jgi:hypothetical protein
MTSESPTARFLRQKGNGAKVQEETPGRGWGRGEDA